jgi:NAD(P)-dependent dehydrogenase (short-subunit alcohol dehydrogenase family)
VPADIPDRAQAEAAVQAAVECFGRLDILVNNAGLMLLGPIVGADPRQWERMIAINQNGLLYMTHAALPHLLTAAEDEPRRVRHRQHLLDRRPCGVGQLRGLQHDQVRRERFHLIVPPRERSAIPP